MSAARPAAYESPSMALRTLAQTLDARAASLLVGNQNRLASEALIRETVALEHSATASDLRRIADQVERGRAPHLDTALAAVAHAERLAQQHARMAELLGHAAAALVGTPSERTEAAAAFDLDPASDTLTFDLRCAVALDIAEVLVDLGTPTPVANAAATAGEAA